MRQNNGGYGLHCGNADLYLQEPCEDEICLKILRLHRSGKSKQFPWRLQVLGHHEDVPAFHRFVTASAAQNEVHAQTLLIDAVQSFLTKKPNTPRRATRWGFHILGPPFLPQFTILLKAARQGSRHQSTNHLLVEVKRFTGVGLGAYENQ